MQFSIKCICKTKIGLNLRKHIIFILDSLYQLLRTRCNINFSVNLAFLTILSKKSISQAEKLAFQYTILLQHLRQNLFTWTWLHSHLRPDPSTWHGRIFQNRSATELSLDTKCSTRSSSSKNSSRPSSFLSASSPSHQRDSNPSLCTTLKSWASTLQGMDHLNFGLIRLQKMVGDICYYMIIYK